MAALASSNRPELVEYAVAYGAARLEVFPVAPMSKRPLVSQLTASCDEATIRGWWAKWPDALIGHRIRPRRVLLDVDPRHGGLATWQALLAGFGDEIQPTRQHHSGRGDGGFHAWYELGDRVGRLSAKPLHEWARAHGVGQEVAGSGGKRWTSGIDLLHHDWRYTILPPSPHPLTGQPYAWDRGNEEPELICDALAELVLVPLALVAELEHDNDDEPMPGSVTLAEIEHPDSVADWFSATQTWASVLVPHGWKLIQGDGDSDGSLWKHPTADPHHEHSASVKYGCLFVYSDQTPLDVTEPGDPNGHTRFAAFTALTHGGDGRAAAAAARLLRPRTIDVDQLPVEATVEPGIFLDWTTFAARDVGDRPWLVEGLWPAGRAVALWAAAKAGKSELALWCAASLALGVHPWNGRAIDPIDVAYFDYEMTEDDLDERLSDFGFDPLRLGRLHYALLPPLEALDSDKGGAQLEALVMDVGARAVIIDTFGRAVSGEEDKADTVRAFYRYTGSRLKRHGVGSLRSDHAGKDKSKGQRGSSAKRDDVDVIWNLSRTKSGLTLDCRESTRLSWVGPTLDVMRSVSPEGTISYSTAAVWGWPAGTKARAAELDALGIPKGLGRGKVIEELGKLGKPPGNFAVLGAAIRYRKDPLAMGPEHLAEPVVAVDKSVDNSAGTASTGASTELFDDTGAQP
jgi:hypothetical protein